MDVEYVSLKITWSARVVDKLSNLIFSKTKASMKKFHSFFLAHFFHAQSAPSRLTTSHETPCISSKYKCSNIYVGDVGYFSRSQCFEICWNNWLKFAGKISIERWFALRSSKSKSQIRRIECTNWKMQLSRSKRKSEIIPREIFYLSGYWFPFISRSSR